MSFPGQFLGSPSVSDTLESVTSSYSDNIDVLVLGKQILDRDGLLKQGSGEIDLVCDRSTVDLDLHDVGLLVPQFE